MIGRHVATAVRRISRLREGRLWGALALVVLTGVSLMIGLPGVSRLRFAWFDVCQRIAPRPPVSAPAVIVAVDAASLKRHGQWPWPRTLLARLIERIAKAGATAIAIDIVMPEPDRLSPPMLPVVIPDLDPDLARRLAALPSNDTHLAEAMKGRRVVLAMMGVADTPEPTDGTPLLTEPRIVGDDPTPFLRSFKALLHSLDVIDTAAAGHGLVNVGLDGNAVRRVPLVARVGGLNVPTLALELFRVASGQPDIALEVSHDGVTRVAVGDIVIPTDPDASVWLRYAPRSDRLFVSAADVLAGTVDRERLERKLVLIGVTALGLVDTRPIPGGGLMDGVEIHAELIEGLVDKAVLARPRWAGWAESGFVFVGGLLLVQAVPLSRARAALLPLLPLLVIAAGASLALFKWYSLLLDAAGPALGLIVIFVFMLSVTLAEADRARRLLRRQVEEQRAAAARMEGELSAARRIQLGILPKAVDLLAGERRFDLHIVLEPAREVGGDLYDFFMLDGGRLFFLLGDVSGKGLPGSLFMAVSKSLYKSTALRRGAAVATMMQEANSEISRDNPENLFVTVFAAVLDVNTGVLEYCNAGHDRPYLLSRGGDRSIQLAEGGGPPLCVLDGYEYTAATHRLRPGDTLCLLTDGVTDARDPAGEQFGRARLEACLTRLPDDASAARVATAVLEDVRQFVAGAEPADDLAILVVRWEGPAGVSAR